MKHCASWMFIHPIYKNYSEITQVHDFKYTPIIQRLLVHNFMHITPRLWNKYDLFLYHLTNHTVRRDNNIMEKEGL